MRRLLLLFTAINSLLAACAHHAPRSFPDEAMHKFRVIAHRGGSCLAPENTMAAFQKAAELNVAFELDVRFSKDEKLVVFHDETLERTTDGNGAIKETPWAKLKKLDAGSKYSKQYAGEAIPTLSEVLTAYAPTTKIDIEIKHKGSKQRAQKLALAVIELLHQKKAMERVMVSSFNPYVLEAFKLYAPTIPRAQLYSDFKDDELAWYKKLILKNLWLNKSADPDILAPDKKLVDKAYVERYHKLGYRIYPYTVNDSEAIKFLYTIGVDGIITDVPHKALAILKQLKLPTPKANSPVSSGN